MRRLLLLLFVVVAAWLAAGFVPSPAYAGPGSASRLSGVVAVASGHDDAHESRASTTAPGAARDAIAASPHSEAKDGSLALPHDSTAAMPTTAGVAAEGVGSGSGPWVDDALTAARPGGATAQSAGGSCVSACGQMLTGGARTQAQLLDELGEWSSPEALASALGPGWRGGGFGSAADAVAAANRGPMGAVLRVPGAQGHMVVTSPMGSGRYLVRDPWGGGSNYEVGTAWIERYVAGGTFR